MTATLGEAKEFDDIKEKWPQCIKQLGHYFLAFFNYWRGQEQGSECFSLCVVVQFEVTRET